MKKILQTFICIAFSVTLQAKNLQKIAAEITKEGKMLYRSEKASWVGTDIFMYYYKDRMEDIGGYFSYEDTSNTKCIFYSKGENPKVIATIMFDSTFSAQTALADSVRRDFTSSEKELYTIRAFTKSYLAKDTFFKTYNNTDFNVIPIIKKGEKKVYVLTGTSKNDVVIFGNDYLLKFDADNKLVSKERLHQNLLLSNYGNDTLIGGVHSHLPETGKFITPTDVCTIMLYEEIANWKSYVVVSKSNMSIWDCKNDMLIIIPKPSLEKKTK